MTTNKNNLTTSWGAPVGDNQNSMTAGSRGPTLIQDVHLLEKLAHFNRERVPERVVHAKGAGAHGYFEVTNDVSSYTKAAFLSEVGKRTPLFARFSTVAGENGSADTVRDPRGFAVKFYTEEGNYDLVGNNTPVFFIRDAIKFPDFIHTQKRDPRTHLKNPTAVWDFWSLSPESLHQVSILMSDRGIPATLRHMHGFGSHTFKWVNAEGDGVWVKYHFKTEQGVKNLSPDVAAKLAGENPDYHTEDLFNAIEKGDFPSWKLYVQIMPLEDADTYRFDPFDVTKVWSQKDYPLIEVGRMVLDRNPENYFAEVEQATFSPGTLVPGIDVSPDKMLQGRLFAYSDAHRYRVGANHQALPINRPRSEVNNYQRDGQMRFDDNGGRSVYYEPNSFGGPTESQENKQAAYPVSGVADSVAYDHNDHYTQAGDLYRLLSEDERTRLVANIVEAMKPVEKEEIKLRQIQHFYKADPEYGTRVADGLGLSVPQQIK
ncbi:catalase [Priestia megaterium]|jgi:catalase|uniref:Catalase n=1 Tax=Priestia megaterium (strain ATCC 14581 / DSM 32 / CCUG 1817 / JCM 2506 / NBRC 15308 / NCIMB 9376 / NCTC 10342 / NRRL B-14308 / VKM B-512 / Ford 19) TaxID=1348623 RepID=A0A0B6AMC9_PRIM2|nr:MULTISPECIES: catalase KatA [Priestia]AJI24671.1 vegetative catalase [Priestia megaterium NBRC 15308 = ATCC 14581]KFN06946.1 catalase [Priestia megaterium]KGJ85091.1 catalase [Priestia megaterium NBRC 15308 = ATCC 14581]MBY0199345.1 catalase [Priestia megaterium]MCU7712003.1 catalase KatA [Priestia megaterium]